MKRIILTLAFLSLSLAALAQEVKQTFTRNVVLEQFTTGQCQYCPAGNDRIASAVDGMSNLIWIKYHAGFGTDALTNETATAYLAYFGGSTYAPALMFDRTRFNTSNPGPVMGVGQVSEIRLYMSQAKSVPTTCKVYRPDVSYNPATRHLSGSVSGRFGDEGYGPDTRMCVYVVEDSFFMYQVDAYNPNGNIYHMSAVRASVTDIWGDPLEVEEEGRTFSYTVDYTLPEDCQYSNCRLVAVVYNYDASDINNRAVLNGSESDYLSNLLGVGEVSEGSRLRLFPNPADGRVFVQCDGAMGRVWVLNALGQAVLQQQGGSDTLALDLDGLAAGIYMVRVETPSGVATRQLVVR